MNPSALFIRRPVATTLLAAGILLLGIVCYSRLPIAALPSVDRPTIGVWAGVPGASADTIATALAQPLERQIGTIPGIVEMSSFSATGGTMLTVQFDLSKDIDAAAEAVQAAINAAGPNLPPDLPQPPSYWKANPSGWPVITLALTSDVLYPSDVYDIADSVVAEQLSQLPGVAQASVSGAERGSVRIRVDPGRIAEMGISLEQIRLALGDASTNWPKGEISDAGQSWTITDNDQLLRARDWRNVVVAMQNGAPVHLRDVAEVTDSVINTRLAGWYDREPGVVIRVYKQPDANVVQTVDAVKAVLPRLEHWMPPSVKVHVIFDRTFLIRAAIADVQRTILIAIALAVMAVLLFLRRLSATLIPAMAIPVALAGTLGAMYLLGYTLDDLSLMALTIAVGFVVDDAVIVIENIIRLTEDGEPPLAAALAGARQVGFTLVAITAALIAALIPVLFMPDVVGRYFREFGMTLVAALVTSLVVSLSFTPMLCGRFLRPISLHLSRCPGEVGSRSEPGEGAARPGPLTSKSRLLALYLASLRAVLRHRALALAAALAVTAGSVQLYFALPKGFMPTQDTGAIYVRTITTANVSFTAMTALQRSVADAILGDPAVDRLNSYIGTDNGSVLSNGEMFVGLKPPAERKLGVLAVIDRLRHRLAKVDGVRVFFTPIQDLALGVQSSASRYQYALIGDEPERVFLWATRMRLAMAKMKWALTDIVQNNETTGLQAGLVIDRVRAAALGVTPQALDNTLYDAFGQRWVRLLFLPHDWAQVVLEVGAAKDADPSTLDRVYVPGVGGGQVPLSAVTRPTRGHAPMWIWHDGQFPATTISFDTVPDVSIGQAIEAIHAAERSVRLPDDIRAEFRGEAGEANKTGALEASLFAAAVFAIYIVLGVLYESYAHPLTILSTLPPAVFGALTALWLTRTQFTLITSIACILLVGMVMKNAILMVDFALEAERRQGFTPAAAILLAARLRVRPIVMTTLVTVGSALPLALGTGPGFELRQPLGIAVTGGLLFSQLVTLYTTPVIYLLVDRLRLRRPARGAQFGGNVGFP